ncbi:ferrochelatase [Commensalibacter oyaizuii]|uniref:Ferrochelatase n=1 Tax=Commensalibacter oyaizuii TaxID=3043873 RepID=A0ABT6Q3N8_9PROT|nr:ferrochelatase [Commensalibacter sp. TBRC 16381]MDI2091745.1 ferrochelatase [Commensalibacter sp. TBRC 16381]
MIALNENDHWGEEDKLQKRIGVLLVNLGTPEGTDYRSIRRYLSQFLSDRRVIEIPPWLWQPILQGPILTFRPRRLSKSYERVWDKTENKSPLAVVTKRQAEKVQDYFNKQNVLIDWAMRYGQPSIAKKLDYLKSKDCNHILILSLYPQYSATTTATVNDAVFKHLMTYRMQPAVRTTFSFAQDPIYIAALKQNIEQKLSEYKHRPEQILLSFHGLPQRYVNAGDPYEQDCQATATALRLAMGKTEPEMPLVYQSRFGPDKWLEPNITDIIEKSLQQGIKRLAVVAPGFMADCLETMDEINHEYRHLFMSKGGEEFMYIPCLNDSLIAINMLHKLITKEIQGWIS